MGLGYAGALMRLAVLILVVLLLSACGRPPIAPGAPPDPRDHPADALALAGLVDEEAVVLVATPDARRLLQLLDWDELVRRRRGDYERMVYEVVQQAGENLLSLHELTKLGVVASGPAALAVVVEPDPAVIVYAQLHDRDAFTTALYRRWEGVEPEPLGNAVLLADGETAVIVRENAALLIRSEGDAADTARVLWQRSRDAPLRRSPAFRRVMRRVGEGRVVAWLDPRFVGFKAMGFEPAAGATLEHAARAIDERHARALRRARDRGASAEDIVRLDVHYRAAMQRLADDPEADELRALLGPLEGIGVVLDLERRRVSIDVDLVMPPDAWLTRLLSGAIDREPLVRTMGADAAALGWVALDMSALADLFDLSELRARDGERSQLSPAELMAQAFTGAVAVACRLPNEALAGAAEVLPSELDVLMLLEVKSRPAAQRVIDSFGEQVTSSESPYGAIDLQLWGNHVALGKATTLERVKERYDNSASRVERALRDADVSKALLLRLDMPTLLYGAAALRLHQPELMAIVRRVDAPGYADKVAELRRVESEINRSLERQRRQRRARYARVARDYGAVELTASKVAGGIHVRGEAELRGSVGDIVATTIDALEAELHTAMEMLAADAETTATALGQLLQRRQVLVEELRTAAREFDAVEE